MIVARLRIAEFPLLAELAAYLDRASCPPGPYDARGDWRADVAAGPPSCDQPKPLRYRRQFLPTPIRLPLMDSDTIVSALNYFPPGGAGLGWHTDSRQPGWRVYLARPLGLLPGCFVTPERVFFDEPGIALAFLAGPGAWHAVVADGERLSMGLRIRGGRTARALGLEDSNAAG